MLMLRAINSSSLTLAPFDSLHYSLRLRHDCLVFIASALELRRLTLMKTLHLLVCVAALNNIVQLKYASAELQR